MSSPAQPAARNRVSSLALRPSGPAHPLLHHQGQLHCFAEESLLLYSLSLCLEGEYTVGVGWDKQQGGQITCFYALGAGSPLSLSPNKRVSCTVLQLVRDKDSFPPLMIPGLALSPTMGSRGQKGRSPFSHLCHHMVDKGGWDQLCCSHAPRASSPVSLTTGLALVHGPGEVHVQRLWPLVAT